MTEAPKQTDLACKIINNKALSSLAALEKIIFHSMEAAISIARNDSCVAAGIHHVRRHIEKIRAALAAVPVVDGETSDGYHSFNELYEHRHILFLCVLKSNLDTAWRSKLHSDGTMFENWFIAGFLTPTGQVTYHLPLRLWDLFNGIRELEKAPEWDGHTGRDVLFRLCPDFEEVFAENWQSVLA